jgi:hypothetical protein
MKLNEPLNQCVLSKCFHTVSLNFLLKRCQIVSKDLYTEKVAYSNELLFVSLYIAK